MSQNVNYVVVSPVRDEERYLPMTISSMAAQTIRPRQWIIVNDGSRDQTGLLVAEAARAHPWIKCLTRSDRGFRQAGGGVIDAFYDGYRLVTEPWDYLVKLDGDLSFDPEYFESCLLRFAENSRLGVAGGTICRPMDGMMAAERVDPRFHVRGATKIYRRACWEEIGGLIHAPGWDTLDEVKANMLGWTTCTFPEIKAIQHRPTGAAYGTWNDKVKGGMANYIAGYHPLFMLVKCIKRLAEKPYFLGGCGLLFGYVKAFVVGAPRVQDKALLKYFHQQQMNRLLFRKSLWG